MKILSLIIVISSLFFSCGVHKLSNTSLEENNTEDDEKFLAEAFIDPLMQSISFFRNEDTNIYFESNVHYWSYYPLSSNPERYSEIFCEKMSVCDENIVKELSEYAKQFVRVDSILVDIDSQWNGKAKIFRQEKYKNVHFISDYEKLLKLEGQNARIFYVAKPIYTREKEYALVAVTTYTTIGNESLIGQYHHLFRRVNGKWREAGKYMILIS